MHKYFSTGQYKNTIKDVHDRCSAKRIPIPTLKFRGTVKLHGTNSSLYNVLNNNELKIQSKNNIINIEKDNNGFARFVENKKSIFEDLFNQIKKQFPEKVIDKTVVVYGEWVGGSIQNNTALGVSKVERMFVIFAMKFTDNKLESQEVIDNQVNDETSDEENIDPNAPLLNEQWFSEEEINNVLTPLDKTLLNKNNIHSIFDFKTFEIDIDMSNPKLTQNKLIELTNEVEKECPVAKQLGHIGVGEGIVWKCISTDAKIEVSDLVFKVKGQEHSVSKVKTIAEVDVVKLNSINEFVEMVLTENRLNQGLEFLKEQHLELNTQNMGPFLKWVANDCLKEESDVLKESQLEKKDVMPTISNTAKQWFLTKLTNSNQSTINSDNKKMKV